MIDWLTLKIESHLLGREVVDRIKDRSGRLLMLDASGEIKWSKMARESIRSDSHQLVVECDTHFIIHGSPARVGGENNVFGSGDIAECASRMIRFAATHLGVVLPADLHQWRVTRVDVTHNYLLNTPVEVMQALSVLAQSEGNRFKVKTQAETVYWGQGSALRTLKAYAKGPHLVRQYRRNEAHASLEEMELAQRLLRLELSLKAQYWRERADKPWYEMTEQDLDQLHIDYFSQVIGAIEVTEMDDLKSQFREAAKRLQDADMAKVKLTYEQVEEIKKEYQIANAGRDISAMELAANPDCEFNQYRFEQANKRYMWAAHNYELADKKLRAIKWSQAMADRAYMAWEYIRTQGLRVAEDTVPRTTMYRYKCIFKEAGLSLADLHSGQVLPFRRRAIELGSPVCSWDDMKRAA